MNNDRPINDPNLQEALDAIRTTMEMYDLAGTVMLVAPLEAAFTYKMDATWSACRAAPGTPMGFRLLALPAVDGHEVTHKRLEGAVHTICQISDFGYQTQSWMTDLKNMLRASGLEFDHTPFGGLPLPHLGPQEPT